MNVIEHFFIGWAIAGAAPQLTSRERFIVTAASVIPDVDGLGMLVEVPTRDTSHPLLWWTDYHHVLAHNVGAAAVVTLLAYLLSKNRWLTATLVCIAFHSHILGDVIGARGPDGYQWPIPYFLPFSRTPELAWDGQWALNAWPNFVITGMVLAITFYLAWSRGISPLEMVSERANDLFVQSIRQRFPRSETSIDRPR